MGLFKKRKTAIERAKIEATHEIVCLYCFRNFDHDEVLFRAAAVMDADGYRAEPDVLLDAYRARFNLAPMGAIAPVLNPDNFSEKNKGCHHGILSTLYDDHNNPTSMRLCPHCHNDILPSAGFQPSTIISLVGAGQAGKSVYLTSLIHTLKSATSLNFEMFCSPLTNEMGRKFRVQYEAPLIENGYILEPTQADIPQEPFIFTFTFADGSKPEINIAFFDVAGEGMANKAYMDIYAAHIRNSSGVMFLVDPQQFRAVGQRTQMFSNPGYDVNTAIQPLEVLGSLVENYIYRQASGVSHIPTAMVLTKTDLLEALAHKGEFFHPRSNLFARYFHRGYFNLAQSDAINYEVDAFLQHVDPNFLYALRRRFANIGLFGVSALGAHPDAIYQHTADFAPVRVDEPFLWMLYKLGYIEGRQEEARS